MKITLEPLPAMTTKNDDGSKRIRQPIRIDIEGFYAPLAIDEAVRIQDAFHNFLSRLVTPNEKST